MSLRSAWRGIDERLRVVIVIAVGFAVIVASLAFVDRATRGRSDATTSSRGSARSTAVDGVRALRTLLHHYGIETDDLAGRIRSDEPVTATLFVLDGAYPDDRDVAAVRAVLDRGGRVVIGGTDAAQWLDRAGPPTGARGPVHTEVTLDGARYAVSAEPSPRWDLPGGSRLVVTRRVGAGTVILLSSTSPLQNDRLARADNAAFGVALAGTNHRAAFAEGIHGLTAVTGFDAIPGGWKLALLGAPVALLLAAVAAGRRIGGAEPQGRRLAPGRRVAIDVLGAAYARSNRPAAALATTGSRVRHDFCRRAGLPPDAPDDLVRAAAARVGWTGEMVDAFLVAPADRESVLRLGRALAHTQRGTP
ncbi:MAG: DUF4350 domain-containing protein [Acidimicrobiia bacterium]